MTSTTVTAQLQQDLHEGLQGSASLEDEKGGGQERGWGGGGGGAWSVFTRCMDAWSGLVWAAAWKEARVE